MNLSFYSQTSEAPCIHFGTCGGCRFQNVPYDEQLFHKESYVRTLFDSIGGEVRPIIGCHSPWRYRNRMDFSFFQKKTGEKRVGFSQKGKKWGGVDLHQCLLTNPWMMDTLQAVRTWWQTSVLYAYHPLSNRGTFRTLTLREGMHTQEKMAVFTVSGDPEYQLTSLQKEELTQVILSSHPFSSIILRTQYLAKKTATRFEEELLYGKDHIHEILHDDSGRKWIFKIGSQDFFQPNTKQAEVIYQTALTYAELKKGDSLLDLYCGAGGFGIFASPHLSKVWGIEMNATSVKNAHENISLNQVSNMEVFEGDVGALLKKNSFESHCMIIDPPRAGLAPKALQEILSLAIPKIVYVSCNPKTQVENCQILKEEGGYRLALVHPIDQFPHTPHVENIVLLVR